MIVSNLHQIVTGLEIILMGDEENLSVGWSIKGTIIFFFVLHPDVKEQLYHYLFSSKKGVILTSYLNCGGSLIILRKVLV